MFISRQKALKTLVGSLFALPTLAKSGTNAAPMRTAVAEFLESNRRSKVYSLAVFDQMPREKMDFKPMPEMFTFQRHFTHCIEFVAGQLTVRLGIKDPFAGKDWSKLTKAETRKEVAYMYDWIEEVVKNATAEQLAKTGDFSADQVDLLRLLYICENHLIHHRGSLMVYLRMCNITPLGYVGW
jgi:uncharacterized damage-inducible protein DinB